ncbi:MAG TPA: hypothetical protein VGW58_11460, partial [Pyrinomonadaceae bacterium]|nr:hypothetical protein [Pyrinomonadaceae bacterium]
KDFLSPSEEDRNSHADFLRTPNTGLIRLLPRETYDDNATKDRKRIVTRGGGAYYSFTRLTHEYGYGSDIELSQDYFSTGFAGLDYGLLTSLGDVPLESVSLETSAANIFAGYNPPSEEPKIRLEQRRFQMGADVQGISASRRLPMKLNSTYVLRSMNYRESDVLVAFRVVRIDSDKSAIVLWKLLKKFPAPQVARNNDN